MKSKKTEVVFFINQDTYKKIEKYSQIHEQDIEDIIRLWLIQRINKEMAKQQ